MCQKGGKMQLNLYTIDSNYVAYLKQFENKVPLTTGKKEDRPFIGLILCVEAKNYFAPLTSPKKKHLVMKDAQDFLRIDKGKLGAINLNNMIPVPRRYLNKIFLERIEDKKYKNLLELQLAWINEHQERISHYARNLYYLITNKTASQELQNRCCNYKLLEEKCKEYMQKNSLREEELKYRYE